MANSDLYGNKWTVPNNVITKLNKELNNSDTSLAGYKRAIRFQEIRRVRNI